MVDKYLCNYLIIKRGYLECFEVEFQNKIVRNDYLCVCGYLEGRKFGLTYNIDKLKMVTR